MIFVTVGTTLCFDELIKAVDDLIANGQISEHVCMQIGNGKYLPKNCQYFRFQKSIDKWISKASLVICHGGTGTVLSLMTLKKTFIAVANPLAADDHQSQFLNQLGKIGALLWTNNINDLLMLIQKAKNFQPQPFHCERLVEDIIKYLNGL